MVNNYDGYVVCVGGDGGNCICICGDNFGFGVNVDVDVVIVVWCIGVDDCFMDWINKGCIVDVIDNV